MISHSWACRQAPLDLLLSHPQPLNPEPSAPESPSQSPELCFCYKNWSIVRIILFPSVTTRQPASALGLTTVYIVIVYKLAARPTPGTMYYLVTISRKHSLAMPFFPTFHRTVPSFEEDQGKNFAKPELTKISQEHFREKCRVKGFFISGAYWLQVFVHMSVNPALLTRVLFQTSQPQLQLSLGIQRQAGIHLSTRSC